MPQSESVDHGWCRLQRRRLTPGSRARSVAGDKDVAIGGAADVANQYLRAGLVDEFQLHVVPTFLGGGARLLKGLPDFTKLQVERA